MFGCDAGDHPDSVDASREFVGAELVEFSARDDRTGDAEFVGDRASSDGVIAGDHLHLDSGAVASFDRQASFGPGRVCEADQPLEAQVFDVSPEIRVRVPR